MYWFMLYRFFVFFKQKTAYEMRISDWSSDVCSSDLEGPVRGGLACIEEGERAAAARERDDVVDRRDEPGDVRHVRERDEAGAVGDRGREGVDGPQPFVVHRHRAEHGARAGGEALPRAEVRVVFGGGDDDLPARVQPPRRVAALSRRLRNQPSPQV